jgi:hypothetical protein
VGEKQSYDNIKCGNRRTSNNKKLKKHETFFETLEKNKNKYKIKYIVTKQKKN